MRAKEYLQPMDKPVSEYQCPGCGYSYDEEQGDDHEGYPPGMAFSDLPDDFVCPSCSVRYKEDFVVNDPS